MTRSILTLTILFLCLSFVGCTTEESMIKSDLKEIGIEISDDLKITKCESSGITDYILETEFTVSDKDKEKIIAVISKTKGFNNKKVSDSIALQSDKWTFGSSSDSTYVLNVHIPTKRAFKEHNLILFYKTNRIKYDYWEE